MSVRIGDKALTSAERMKRYRQRLKTVIGKEAIKITISKNILSMIDDHIGVDGNSRAEIIENVIREIFGEEV